jgi:2,4-dienoyl-CoA reductase-like NADH-dependent reductase (Old Yellow Enzyme family)
VERDGRITYGDLGIWSDAHVPPLARVTAFLKSQGAVSAIQLAHAGRKASMQRPWHGNGPMDQSDRVRGEQPWSVVAPSAIPVDAGWLMPHELTLGQIEAIKGNWHAATLRARAAGFEIVEVHGAHGYLIHEFLSPLSNKRADAYGGDPQKRMRLALEIAGIVRENWPADHPVFFRLSATDGVEGGWTLDDSVALARRLKALGVDVIDCSSGGIAGPATAARVKRTLGFQVPFAQRIREDAGVQTMAVGLILEAHQAEAILQAGQADLIAIGRQALFNPNWALHAELALDVENEFASWPVQAGWWLERRQRSLAPEDATAAVKRVAGV